MRLEGLIGVFVVRGVGSACFVFSWILWVINSASRNILTFSCFIKRWFAYALLVMSVLVICISSPPRKYVGNDNDICPAPA